MTPVTERDLAVIGAGPVGLYAAYYAGFRGLSTVIVDSLDEPGDQITAMYPEKPIYDIAGFPAVAGRDLVAALVEQAARFTPTYALGQRAQRLERNPDGTFEITTHSKANNGEANNGEATARVRALIIAGGVGTFTPTPLPAGEGWLGRGLAYFVPSLEAHRGKDVVIVGGGDSACDWALGLEPIARSVILVHRRKAFRAHAHTVSLLQSSCVRVITDSEVTELQGGDTLESVQILGPDGIVLTTPAQAVVAALGFTANLGPLRDWGIEITANRYLPVDTTMATNLSGVYAAGDIAETPPAAGRRRSGRSSPTPHGSHRAVRRTGPTR